MDSSALEQFKCNAKIKAVSTAETLQPMGRNMQAIGAGVTEVKSVENLLRDAEKIYQWLIKDISC